MGQQQWERGERMSIFRSKSTGLGGSLGDLVRHRKVLNIPFVTGQIVVSILYIRTMGRAIVGERDELWGIRRVQMWSTCVSPSRLKVPPGQNSVSFLLKIVSVATSICLTNTSAQYCLLIEWTVG